MFRNRLLVLVLGILFLGAGIAWRYQKGSTTAPLTPEQPATSTSPGATATHGPCLAEGEVAEYPLDERFDPALKTPKGTEISVSIKDVATRAEKFSFTIQDIHLVYHPLELHKCALYAQREFGFDRKTSKLGADFRREMWRYTYDGVGEKLLTIAEMDRNGNPTFHYSSDFRVDLGELYISLLQNKGSSSAPSYELAIRSLKTGRDVFKLPRLELVARIKDYRSFQEFGGDFSLREWKRNGKYFWADVSSGANVTAFVRIERDTWKTETFPVPIGVLGGDALNPERGYITYNDGPGWIGIDVIAEQVYEEWRKQGKIISFYVHNLATNMSTRLATSSEPDWWPKPKWISDTDLQYELSTGEKKIYKIQR